MRAIISKLLIERLSPAPRPYEVRDTRLKGFLLRVQPSGTMTYYVEFARGQRIAIGRANTIKLDKARDKAKAVLAEAYQGNDPTAAIREAKAHTLGSFITEAYEPWAASNKKTAEATVARPKSSFSDLQEVKLGDLTAWQIERWRTQRFKKGAKATTINRDLDDLRSSLNKAVARGLFASNPVKAVRRSRVDGGASVRFLTAAEELHLRSALKTREERLRRARYSANQWRIARGYAVLPDFSTAPFVGRLRPMVLLSLNTGLRRGEVFSLTWGDVDFANANLTVQGSKAKSGRTRHIPLNEEAISTLRAWKPERARSTDLVFSGNGGTVLNNVRRAWLGVLRVAGIEKFRWHDLRHSFASNLVMAGVDLNTVRELLGHSDYKMTLRYAHLAPEHKAAAVAKLIRNR
jgi:integrase